jgi:hypothetical protein
MFRYTSVSWLWSARNLTVLMPITAVVYVAVLWATIQPVLAFVTVGRWSTNGTQYQTTFRSNTADQPFPASTYNLVVSAANKWSKSSTGKNFTLYNYTGQVGPTPAYVTKASFSQNGWAGNPGVNQITFGSGSTIKGSTLYLNSDWSWNTSCGFDQKNRIADLLTILIHETGHTVSLNHDSSHPESVMWPDYRCKHNLSADDINGIARLYP